MASEERLALHYSDGSMTVLAATTPENTARHDREMADLHEARPGHLTNIVRVRFEIVEVVEENRRGAA